MIRAPDGSWHFWATHNPACTDHQEFPAAAVHRYHATTLSAARRWNTSGAAVSLSGVHGGACDAYSVFAPQSPFGPWVRSKHNPVFHGSATPWCGGAGKAARVDEADAYVVRNRKLVVVKGVCANFTALPTAWVSRTAGTFDPAYTPLEESSSHSEGPNLRVDVRGVATKKLKRLAPPPVGHHSPKGREAVVAAAADQGGTPAVADESRRRRRWCSNLRCNQPTETATPESIGCNFFCVLGFAPGADS